MNPKQPKYRPELLMAIVWSVLVLVLCFHQLQFWRSNNLDSDVMALLPSAKHEVLETRANDNMAKVATGHIVVLVGSADSEAPDPERNGKLGNRTSRASE